MLASPLADHHTVEELETAYRSATRATERSKWQIIWLKKIRLSDEEQETLREVINNNPDNQWTSEKVRIYILEEFKVEMTEVCAWGYLKRLAFGCQQPRPKNLNSATDEEKADFVKKSL